MHTCRRIEQDNLFRSCPVNLMCMCVCVSACMSIHVQDSVLLPGFFVQTVGLGIT